MEGNTCTTIQCRVAVVWALLKITANASPIQNASARIVLAHTMSITLIRTQLIATTVTAPAVLAKTNTILAFTITIAIIWTLLCATVLATEAIITNASSTLIADSTTLICIAFVFTLGLVTGLALPAALTDTLAFLAGTLQIAVMRAARAAAVFHGPSVSAQA